MALMCATCGTENRDAAKFCRGCGGKLVALPPRSAKEREAVDEAWGETVQSSLEEDLRGDDLDEPTVIVPPGASRPARLGTGTSASQPRRIRDTRSHAGFWAVVGVALLVAAAGGWYAYRARVSPAAAAPGPVAVNAPAVQSVAAVPAPAPAPAPAAVATPPAPEAAAVAAPSRRTASTVAQAPAPTAPAATRTPRKTAPPPVPTPPAATVAPAPLAPEAPPPVAAAPLPSPPPAPQNACGGRNFIATAQCMAAQCARSEFAAHAQCEPVRRQQRIEEEKRNPLYAN